MTCVLDDPHVWAGASSPLAGAGPRFNGLVAGAWGGHSAGKASVAARADGFDAELALDAGSAVRASVRCGGHSVDWLRVMDAGAAPGGPVPLDVVLSITGHWHGPPLRQRGWGAGTSGAAFLCTEDTSRSPLRLRLALDPAAAPGMATLQANHRISVPNGLWFPLRLRFASHLQSSLDQAPRWRVNARLGVRTAGAADTSVVSVRRGFAAADLPTAPAPEETAPCGPRTPAGW